MFIRLQRIRFEDRGASMVEYGLLVVLIAIVALVAVQPDILGDCFRCWECGPLRFFMIPETHCLRILVG